MKITTTSNVAIRRAVTPSATYARVLVTAGGSHRGFGGSPMAWRPQASDLTYVTTGFRTDTVTGDQKKFNGNATARRTQFVPRDLDHRRTPV